MRVGFAVLAALALTACSQATASKLDERTFRVEGPAMGIASDAPNKRLAARLCPGGYRLLDSESHKGGADRATYENDQGPVTTWTIRCL